MNFIKNLAYILLILILWYMILVFVSPQKADSLWNFLWTMYINENLRDFKSKLDFFSLDDKNWNILQKASDVWSWVIQARDIITNKITETKTDLDKTREAVQKTNENIQKTQESIDNTLKSVNDVQDSIKNIVQ